MFIGHFAAGLAGKRAAPRASLGTYVAAAVFLDIVWPIFVLAGVETFRIVPGLLPMNALDFISYPWSHSLLAAVFWSVAFGWTYHALRRDAATARMLGAVVFSHFVLDWITHRPDLALAPGLSFKTGLGLWRSVPATVVVEGTLFAAAVWWYARGTEPKDRTGRWSWIAFVVVLALLYAASLGPTPEGQEIVVVAVGLAMSCVFVPWAAWIDRHRIPR